MVRPLRLALCLSALAGTAAAQCTDMPEPEAEFEDARLLIEYNSTDGDIGVHGEMDSPGWRELCLYAPGGTLILHVAPQAQFAELGLGELFFESREPEEESFGYEDLKAAFPEGTYGVRGVDAEGKGASGEARFTTLVPAPVEITAPEIGDGDEAPEIPVADLHVAWTPSTSSLDGRTPDIVAYQLIVTDDEHEDPDAFSQPEFSVYLEDDVNEFTVPASFFRPGTLYEIEVIALESSGNQTITLGFVETAGK